MFGLRKQLASKMGVTLDIQVHKTPTQVTLRKMCSVANQMYELTVSRASYEAWINGQLSQRAFPNLTAEQRDFMTLRLTPKEQEAMGV